MDTETIQAWAALTAAATGLAAIIASFLLERGRRDDIRRDRLLDVKRTLASDLLIAADKHRDQAMQQVARKVEVRNQGADPTTVPSIGLSEPIRSAYLALTLVAPAVATSAMALYVSTVRLGTLASECDPTTVDRAWNDDWVAETKRWPEVRDDFVAAVHVDLGIDLARAH